MTRRTQPYSTSDIKSSHADSRTKLSPSAEHMRPLRNSHVANYDPQTGRACGVQQDYGAAAPDRSYPLDGLRRSKKAASTPGRGW